jgi:hypothetical protein
LLSRKISQISFAIRLLFVSEQGHTVHMTNTANTAAAATLKCSSRECVRAAKACTQRLNPRTGEPDGHADMLLCNQHAAAFRSMERNGMGTCRTVAL